MKQSKKTEAARLLQSLRKYRKGGYPKGKLRVQDRCPCGVMTADRAKKRGHKCEAKEKTA